MCHKVGTVGPELVRDAAKEAVKFADNPYDMFRRALRADIADEAWESVNSTISRPFPRPRSGKIAIKVINHYGDEVLKINDTHGDSRGRVAA